MKLGRVIVVIIAVLLIAAGLVFIAWTTRPSVVEVQPLDGATGIPVISQFRIKFSRPMDEESVTSRLKVEPAVDGSFSWDGNSLSFTPNTAWPDGEEIRVSLAEGAEAQSWLAFPMQAESWSFTTSTAFLAYLWPPDGPADIYALNPLSGVVSEYTSGMNVLEFSASSDGLVLYFSSGNQRGGADLYRIDRKQMVNSADQSYQPEKLVECGSAQCRLPAVSADGRFLAYEYLIPDAGGELGPAIIRLVGLPDLNVIPMGLADHETVQPAWSSTGWLAYYDRTTSNYGVFEPATGASGLLANETGQPGNWSPDGKYYLAPEIYYYQATENSETGTSHLLRYDVPSGTWADLSTGDDVEDVEGMYSPGGERIAFARKYLHEGNWSFGREIWIMNADGSEAHAITDEPNFNHYDLAWSRDGKALAYVRFNEAEPSEPPELWMINADGSNPIELVVGGYSPLWIP